MNQRKTYRNLFRACANKINRLPELEYIVPELIAVLLSAQATDVSVNEQLANSIPVANTPEKILALGEEKGPAFISNHRPCFITKAKNTIATPPHSGRSNTKGQIPRTREALEGTSGRWA